MLLSIVIQNAQKSQDGHQTPPPWAKINFSTKFGQNPLITLSFSERQKKQVHSVDVTLQKANMFL